VAEFIFEDTSRPFVLKNASGDTLAEFSVDIGNEDLLRDWINKADEMQNLDVDKTDKKDLIDKVKSLSEDLIESIFGPGSWDTVWGLCNNNISTLMRFDERLSLFVKEIAEELMGNDIG
jgi:hypothetical protein